MAKVRLIIQSCIPWVIFFALDNYGPLELNIAIISALTFIIIFNNKSLQQGFLLEWASLLYFFFLLIVVTIFNETWFTLNAPVLAYYTLASVTWLSILIRRPLAMHFAKLNVTKELWNSRLFYRVNNIVTVLWALILSTIALLSTIQSYAWGGTIWLTELMPTALFLLGIWFTFWFPEWYKRTIIGEWGVLSIKNLSGLQISHSNIASIAFRTLGRGPKLILLPPSRMNMYSWDPQLLRLLSKRHQVIIVDYPDIGKSKLKQGEYTVSNLADAIAEFIEDTSSNNEKIGLLGYSLGGWIAQEIAIKHSELVNKLALIATDVGSPRSVRTEQSFRDKINAHSSATENVNDDILKLLFPTKVLRNMAPKVRAIFNAANLQDDISNSVILLQQHMADLWYQGSGSYQQLGEIDANTVIIVGAQDMIVNRQNLMLLVNGIRGAQLVEYPDAGHGLIYQHPCSIAETVNKL